MNINRPQLPFRQHREFGLDLEISRYVFVTFESHRRRGGVRDRIAYFGDFFG
jgi:hypothetical protein